MSRSTIKSAIVRLVVWGLLHAGLAQWLINTLGLREGGADGN